MGVQLCIIVWSSSSGSICLHPAKAGIFAAHNRTHSVGLCHSRPSTICISSLLKCVLLARPSWPMHASCETGLSTSETNFVVCMSICLHPAATSPAWTCPPPPTRPSATCRSHATSHSTRASSWSAAWTTTARSTPTSSRGCGCLRSSVLAVQCVSLCMQHTTWRVFAAVQ